MEDDALIAQLLGVSSQRAGTTGHMRRGMAANAGPVTPQGPTWGDLASMYGDYVQQSLADERAAEAVRSEMRARGDYSFSPAAIGPMGQAVVEGFGMNAATVGRAGGRLFSASKNIGDPPKSGHNVTPSGVTPHARPDAPAAPGPRAQEVAAEEISVRPALPERTADGAAGREGLGVDRLPGGGVGKTALDQFGNPMLAKHVIGRRHEGGPDVPLDIDAARDLAALLTRGRVEEVKRSGYPLYGDDGRVYAPKRPGADPEIEMYIAKGLDAGNTLGVFRHENGHAIKLRGGISDGARPPPGVDRAAVDAEMEALSRAIRPNLWASDAPKLKKYRQQGDELFADSVQAYSADPARIRKEYPSFAAYLQWVSNDNPLLKRHVQFNEMATALGGASIGTAGLLSGGEAQAAPTTLEELMGAR